MSFWPPTFFPSLVDIAIAIGLCILGGHNSSVVNWVSDDMASRGRKHLRTVFVGPWVSWPAIKCMRFSKMIGHCSSYGYGRLLAVYHTNDWISSTSTVAILSHAFVCSSNHEWRSIVNCSSPVAFCWHRWKSLNPFSRQVCWWQFCLHDEAVVDHLLHEDTDKDMHLESNVVLVQCSDL